MAMLRRACTAGLAAFLSTGATGFAPAARSWPAPSVVAPVPASGRRPAPHAPPPSSSAGWRCRGGRAGAALSRQTRRAAEPTTSATSEAPPSSSSAGTGTGAGSVGTGAGDDSEAAGAAMDTYAAVTGGYNPSYAVAMASLAAVITAAGVFDLGIYYFKGFDSALDFVAGFLVEESLSVDNLFVFLLLFDYFKVPLQYQPRVLQYGIGGAVVLRGVFILAGAVAIERFRPVLLLFAGILLVSSGKLLFEFFGGGDGGDDDEDLSDNAVVKVATALIDATDTYDEDKFFTEVPDAADPGSGALVRRATPLLLVLACVELSDIVFAVDSVPAVFGVTEDPLIVFSSNLFAILGLRSVYTLLADAVAALPYLEPAVAVVLGFVGVKLGLEYEDITISNAASLCTIVSLLAAGIGASYLLPPPDGGGDGGDGDGGASD